MSHNITGTGQALSHLLALRAVADAARQFRDANAAFYKNWSFESAENRKAAYDRLLIALDALDNPAVQSPDDHQEPDPGAQGGQS